MQTQVINKDTAEVFFGKFNNNSGATILRGQAAVLDVAVGQVNGNKVVQPTTATLSLFVGLAVDDILNGDDGTFQTWGYHRAGSVIDDVAQAITAGDILIPVDGASHLDRSGPSDGLTGFVVALEDIPTNASPVAAPRKVFIRA